MSDEDDKSPEKMSQDDLLVTFKRLNKLVADTGALALLPDKGTHIMVMLQRAKTELEVRKRKVAELHRTLELMSISSSQSSRGDSPCVLENVPSQGTLEGISSLPPSTLATPRRDSDRGDEYIVDVSMCPSHMSSSSSSEVDLPRKVHCSRYDDKFKRMDRASLLPAAPYFAKDQDLMSTTDSSTSTDTRSWPERPGTSQGPRIDLGVYIPCPPECLPSVQETTEGYVAPSESRVQFLPLQKSLFLQKEQFRRTPDGEAEAKRLRLRDSVPDFLPNSSDDEDEDDEMDTDANE